MSNIKPSLDMLREIVYHLFLPPKLPQHAPDEEKQQDLDLEICHLMIGALAVYRRQGVPGDLEWARMDRMLRNLAQTISSSLDKHVLIQQMSQMQAGDILALQVRAQNAAVLIRKQASTTIFEVFEVRPATADVMSTTGRLVRSFPGPAVEVPEKIAKSGHFIQEIANFLSQMDSDVLDESAAKTKKAGSTVLEVRDSAHPHYITELFLGILLGMGKDAQPRRIVKRLADEVLWHDAYKPWRRSPLWLIIRVALQTSLSSATEYKHFVLFFKTRILRYCLKHDSFPSELLFTMRVKMSRRFRKVQDSAPDFIGAVIENLFNQTEKVLQSRWSKVQSDQARSAEWAPENFDMNKAVIQSLPNSRVYLNLVLNRRLHRQTPYPFVPRPRTRLLGIKDFARFAPPTLFSAFEETRYTALFDFEDSVRNHLGAWTNENLGNPSACTIIAWCFSQYISATYIQYASNVLDQSMMFLILMELWVALDKLATSQCPLLLDYPPEIPEQLLEPLLIRSTNDIDRANEIQRYLRRRHRVAQASARGSVFSSMTSSNTLAVRYFRQSLPHQELKQAIERDANSKRDQKVKELDGLNETHKSLVERAETLECVSPQGKKKKAHRRECEKCRLTYSASQLKIQVHEWPLPQDSFAAEIIVFELMCPEPFRIWRDVTYTLLRDFGGAERGDLVTPYRLLGASDVLQAWFSPPRGIPQRVVMGSTKKSFLQAHYASVIIPATPDKACVNFGMSFELYDLSKHTWASGPFAGVTAASFGSLRLSPGSSYLHLGYALHSTLHTSNQVIADQYRCPTDLSLHEHIAFGTLRAGPHLQWMNIVRGLEENCLTFSRDEVCLLHSQAAWQIGPLSVDGKDRAWHVDLMDPNYGRLLVAQAFNLTRRVKANWLESTSVRTAILLVQRLLSSSVDPVVVENSYLFLREARAVALDWLNELAKKLQGATTDSKIIYYQYRVCEMAMICRSTYDVDFEHIPHLFSNSGDISAFISCSIIICDNTPPELSKMSTTLQMLFARDRRLSNTTVSTLLEKVQQAPQILNETIGAWWPGYQASAMGWVKLPAPNSCWVTTHTAVTGDGVFQQIHLDLLEGRLLIDGNPLGRLPQEYFSHPVYTRLFGQAILDIVPANLPGMVFATRAPINGHQVYFALDPSTNDLIVRAQIDGMVSELIPHYRLRDDFPLSFSSNYHHWLNIKSRVLEFRPLSTPWLPDTKNWRMLFSQAGNAWMVSYAEPSSLYLLDFHGHPFQEISRQISRLETPQHLHATHSASSGIQVDLPRMRLSFFLNGDFQLESNNLRGLVVDRNQSSGTMLGLRNQLLLCAKDPAASKLPQSRIVLIPHGEISFKSVGDHVAVTIDSGSDLQVDFHQFTVDRDLQYLASTTGLTSRLFKIYLHAITSHCLPDPLTGRTGTEEALHELSGAATFSFEQLDEAQARLLSLIDSLTPAREYYPPHIRAMQTTHWANLPTLSQHYAFHASSRAILDRAETLRLFHPLSFDLASYMRDLEPALLERSARRTWFYYPHDTASGLRSKFNVMKSSDRKYVGRDLMPSDWVSKGNAARWASGLAYHRWQIPTFVPCALVSALESRGEMAGLSKDLDMTYSPRWLRMDIAALWIPTLNLCRQAHLVGNRYSLAICLASGVYGGGLPHSMLRAFVSVASNSLLASLAPPPYFSYRIPDGYYPTATRIQLAVSKHARSLENSPAKDLPSMSGESESKLIVRRRNYYRSKVSELTTNFTEDLANLWPSLKLQPATDSYSAWFDVSKCIETVEKHFSSCAKNLELLAYLKNIEDHLSSQPTTENLDLPLTATSTRSASHPADIVTAKPLDCILLSDLMKMRECPGSANLSLRGGLHIKEHEGVLPDTSRLAALLSEFCTDKSHPLRQRYGKDLENSREDLLAKPSVLLRNRLPPSKSVETNRNRYLDDLTDIYTNIKHSLGPKNRAERMMATAGIWPRIAPRPLFESLSLRARESVDSNWLGEVVTLARAFINHQRAQRLVGLVLGEKREEFFKELEYDAGAVAPESYDPDWLLIQIDSNFSTRSMQSKVANEMISPSSGANTVLQLNMGEGKSSVIVPIVAATLANSNRLVRVVVLKPLWRQMFQLLVSRLSGLANRRIYYLPFGRHIHVQQDQARKIQDLYTECMREGGVLLVQPEHILSFKLMGVDRLISSTSPEDIAVSRSLQNMQDWLGSHSRDILDESDEILHVRYQLVYTVGEQQSLEDHPDRWTTTQQILPLVCNHLMKLKTQFPDNLQHEARSSFQFPFIRIMPDSERVVECLHYLLAEDALEGRIPNMNLIRLPAVARKRAFRFLTDRTFAKEKYRLLKDECDPSTWKGLLLLRGLIACGILTFALREKHYRVDYGLCLSRSLLAVPFHAKDTPSLRAEFGHPDVAVVLTCLSYYYQGLTDAQLRTCFELLYKLDNPALEYDQWVHKIDSLPQEFRQLNSVNVEDNEKFKQVLVPAFASSMAVINFFLSSVVFPKQAKQFPHKLVTSGWDLAETKSHVTTGFSGTNDNQYLLPTSITQADPLNQSSTNAMVLTYMLQSENNHYLCTRRDTGEACSAPDFMKLLVGQTPEIRVLLDVGAQMLELQNVELVRLWLKLRPDMSAAVFFSEEDDLMVLPQNGSPTSLLSSPFAQQLDKCVVYLDDGHTRGTDLKLPRGTRAAVTLGPKVTKDRLLQGCMRMRMLGHGHSVMFFAPPGIDRQIRKSKPAGVEEPIQVLDILRWAMLETCHDLTHFVAHWTQQGVQYHRRVEAQRRYLETSDITALKDGWTLPETYPLEGMYGASSSPAHSSSELSKAAHNIPSLKARLELLGVEEVGDPSMNEEQEREVSHEVERERHIERPPRSLPAAHVAHIDVQTFIQTGVIPTKSKSFLPLFLPLQSHDPRNFSAWPPKLLASVDFATTIAKAPVNSLSDYMRPVNWIVSAPGGILVVLSPYEVNRFILSIRNSSKVRLHIYSPRVTRAMKSFSDLYTFSLPTIPTRDWSPPSLVIQMQLNLWAGQLYLKDYVEYLLLCYFLGIYTTSDDNIGIEVKVQVDGFVLPADRRILAARRSEYQACGFVSSPIAILRELIGRRRKGMDYMRTHVGQILHGRRLLLSDLE